MDTKAARIFAERLLPEKPRFDLHWIFSGRAFIQAAYVLVETQDGLSGQECETRCRKLLAGPLDPVLERMRGSAVPEISRVAMVLDQLTHRERVSILALAASAAMHQAVSDLT